MPPTDAFLPLVRLAQDGDADAWEALMLPYQPWLVVLVRRRASSDVLARLGLEDVVQEILLQLWRGLPGTCFPSRQAFEAWLVRVARHRLVDVIRRAVSGKRHAIAATGSSGGSKHLEALPAAATSPSRAAARHEAHDAVRRILARLPERYRSVLELIRIDGFTTAQVAEILGITAGAVRKRLERGLALCNSVANSASFDAWRSTRA